MLAIVFLLSVQSGNAQHRFRTKISPQKVSETSLDVGIFRTFNKIQSPAVNSIVSVTNSSIVPVSALLPVGLYASARINDNAYDENSSVLLFLSEALNFGVTQALKETIKRPRPYRSLNNVQLSETSSVAGTYSFPSGHASASFTIATLLTLRYPDEPWIISGSFAYAAVTSLGRLYWGVHYPSDVLAGMLIGAGSAALIYSLRSEIIPAKDRLFNQSTRPDERVKSPGLPVVIGSVAAADILNHFISGSGLPLIEAASVGYLPDGTYTLNCRIEF